jgi:uncharacterized protein YjbI with pentapeptide repeats
LQGANLSNAHLNSANLIGADLTGADLSNSHLNAANLTEAILTGAYLINADLSGTKLPFAFMAFARLSGATLDDTVDLRGAILWGADLSDLKISNTSIVYYNDSTRWPVGFTPGSHFIKKE